MRSIGSSDERAAGLRPGTGARRAAILMIALDPETGSAVFDALSSEDRRALSAEIEDLGDVGRVEMQEVLASFKDVATLRRLLPEGETDDALDRIRSALPEERADRLVRLLRERDANDPLGFLESIGAEEIAGLLRDEHAQTIALVLAHLTPRKAARVLAWFVPGRRPEIVQRLSTLESTRSETVDRVGSVLRSRLAEGARPGTPRSGDHSRKESAGDA